MPHSPKSDSSQEVQKEIKKTTTYMSVDKQPKNWWKDAKNSVLIRGMQIKVINFYNLSDWQKVTRMTLSCDGQNARKQMGCCANWGNENWHRLHGSNDCNLKCVPPAPSQQCPFSHLPTAMSPLGTKVTAQGCSLQRCLQRKKVWNHLTAHQ